MAWKRASPALTLCDAMLIFVMVPMNPLEALMNPMSHFSLFVTSTHVNTSSTLNFSSLGSRLQCSLIKCSATCQQLRSQCSAFMFLTGSCQLMSLVGSGDIIMSPSLQGLYLVDPCSGDNNPCQNSGICTVTQWPNIICTCQLGFKGVYCERGCPGGFKFENSTGSCYKFEPNVATSWTNAASICASYRDGAHLVFIESATEQAFIKQHISPVGAWWTGGQRFNPPTTMVPFVWKTVWINGTVTYKAITSYTDWSPGQPDNLNNVQYCLALLDLYGYKWDDAMCSSNYNFICEFELI